jgi:molecular chaperone GrpE
VQPRGNNDEEHQTGTPEEDAVDEEYLQQERAESGDHPRKKHRATRKDLEREVEKLSEELDRVRTDLEDTKDKFLRSLADFDNYRKRVAREKEQLQRCASEELIKRLLEVIDNIERALEVAGQTHDFEGFKKGIELIYVHIKDVLSREGLCPIQCLGKDFDPNYHEAVMAIEKEGQESEKVVEEIQRGYLLDGRVIRPSKVVVSK